MTTANLAPDLRLEEAPGGRPLLRAYPDPQSGKEPWTIGYGHTGPNIRQGTTCTKTQAEAWLAADIAATEADLKREISWWATLSDVRQDALVDMTFNMGLHGLLEFTHMLASLQEGLWHIAAAELRQSDYAQHSPPGVMKRAARLALMIETGIHQPVT